MKNKFDIYKFLQGRPLSWSAISSFEWDKREWHEKYILGIKSDPSNEMEFGKMIADSFQTDKPLAPVTLYPVVEQKLSVIFNKIPLIGFIDTYDPKTHNFREFKTSKKIWTKEKAQLHGQLRMYALCLFITHKVKPEDYTIHLDCIQTQSGGDFSIDFVKPFNIVTHEVKLTMKDVLEFAARLKRVVEEMEQFVNSLIV